MSTEPTPSSPEQAPRKNRWLSVGVKLMLGVALASNGCIGSLLLLNHQAAKKIERMMDEVLVIREEVSADLRGTIVQLQQEFINLPQLFESNPTQVILAQVEKDFSVLERQRLVGREAYGSHYSRTEKRDLAKGLMVLQQQNEAVYLSRGMINESGAFTEEVERLTLRSTDAEADRQRLQDLIQAEEAKASGIDFYTQGVNKLRSLAADKSLAAEQSRIRILSHVDQIAQQEQHMQQTMAQQRRWDQIAGAITIVINILVLFALTRIIVERPLGRLTRIVEALGAGQFPDIPWSNRGDEIGVLSASIARFREALLRLQQEEQRKHHDRQRIEETVQTMTEAIHGLDTQAAQMTEVAIALQELAGRTEQISTDVTLLADDSARRTEAVSDSSRQISTAVEEIHCELGVQNGEVSQIVAETGRARQQLDELNRSVAEIDTIVGTVRAITDQTKILAINAAIEAVKAGEFGRGFAVVAGEVKTLSQNTALATQDVLEKIEAINRTCQSFTAAFDNLEQGSAALHRITTSIDQAVGRQHRLTDEIVELSGATGTDTREVSTRIAQVSHAAGEVLRLSGDTRGLAEEIARQLEQLLSGSVGELGAMCRRDDAFEAPLAESAASQQ